MRLLDFHPDLGVDLDEAAFERAKVQVACPVITAEPGPFDPAGLKSRAGRVSACVVVEGLLAREVALAGRTSVTLYGPRDVIGVSELAGASVPAESRYLALTPVRFAVLDDRFLAHAQRWPRLAGRLMESVAEQVGRGCVRQAISQLPRAEDRIVALFWLLADGWGRVGSDGVHIDLSLTHEALGQLIGARRPTVSLAMRELAEAGLLHRRASGGWLLALSSLGLLDGPRPIEGMPEPMARQAAH